MWISYLTHGDSIKLFGLNGKSRALLFAGLAIASAEGEVLKYHIIVSHPGG
jgi:hypothetical protein